MHNQLLIAITGPTGSGKSTVAKLLAAQTKKCVNIDVDLVKHFIVSDFRYEEANGIDQWELLGKNIGMVARNFHDEGYNVIVNGYLREQAWAVLEDYIRLTHKFLLLPELDVIQKRDAERQPIEQMGKKAVVGHYEFFSTHRYYKDFVKIDSSQQTTIETIADIVSKL